MRERADGLIEERSKNLPCVEKLLMAFGYAVQALENIKKDYLRRISGLENLDQLGLEMLVFFPRAGEQK